MTPSQFIHTAPRESDRVLHPEQDLQPSRPVLRCPATGGDNLWILLFVELGKQIEREMEIFVFLISNSMFQVVLLHSAVQLHHQHILSLAFLTLSLKIIFLVSSQKFTSSLTIPLLLTTATWAGLALVFISNCINDTPGSNISENEMLLRTMKKNAKTRRKAD